MQVVLGDILQQRYRVDSLIGRGGMGHVFSATDLESPLQAQVAVKIVSGLLADKTIAARLRREAQAAQRIESDFVPRVTDVGETSDGETFLVMERLFGEPLSQRIREHGALPWTEVMAIGEDVLRGLIDAHTAGIVHRDLKPSNVFLALKNGRVRAMVLDFGVCKVDGIDHERLTATGESIGTCAYMAPEQIRGASTVDERADLYAFGAVVFEMLCGRLPHEGTTNIQILASKLEREAASLAAHARVTLPDGVTEIVTRALARDPAQRFASAQELLKAWRGIGKPRSSSTLPPAPPSTEANLASLEPNPTETSLAGPASPRVQSNARLALALTAASLVVGLSVVGITVSRSSAAARAAAAAAAQEEAAQAEAAAATPEGSADLPPESFELPDEAPAAPGAAPPADPGKPRVKRSARPKSSGTPKISSQPRY